MWLAGTFDGDNPINVRPAVFVNRREFVNLFVLLKVFALLLHFL